MGAETRRRQCRDKKYIVFSSSGLSSSVSASHRLSLLQSILQRHLGNVVYKDPEKNASAGQEPNTHEVSFEFRMLEGLP